MFLYQDQTNMLSLSVLTI